MNGIYYLNRYIQSYHLALLHWMVPTYDCLSGSSLQSLLQRNIMLYDILYYYSTNWCNHTNMEHWFLISINYLLLIVGTRSFFWGVFGIAILQAFFNPWRSARLFTLPIYFQFSTLFPYMLWIDIVNCQLKFFNSID